MKPIAFEIQRTIRAPIDEVFARLVDIDGHNDWMTGTGSVLKRTWQTSPGEPTGNGETLVRHRGKVVPYGVWRLGTPIWRRFAVKERTITIDALKASFEGKPNAPGDGAFQE